jgi:hypothetical protein
VVSVSPSRFLRRRDKTTALLYRYRRALVGAQCSAVHQRQGMDARGNNRHRRRGSVVCSRQMRHGIIVQSSVTRVPLASTVKRIVALSAIVSFFVASARSDAAEQPLRIAQMKLLYCSFGSIGLQPNPLPSGFENQFAVAVVEVNSYADIPNAPPPTITLFDEEGKSTKTKRVISVSVFDEPYIEHEGNAAFWLGTARNSRTHLWDGTLPAGMIHLRVRVALATQEMPHVGPGASGGRCTVTIGGDSVEGPVDSSWPT